MRDLDLRGHFTRDRPIDLERSVLLVIDVQNATISEAESKIQPFFSGISEPLLQIDS